MDTPKRVEVEPTKSTQPPVVPAVKVEPKDDLKPKDEAVKPAGKPPVVTTTH